MRVADYIAYFLKIKKIKEIFMFTGYGAMYLNDAIKLSGIKYYATRNEATAPIMAESYDRIKNKIGVACVTAGPGASNALPGLAEAYVDSAPILVLSGQVDYQQTTYSKKSNTIRTFGTAEINIIPIVKPLTGFAAEKAKIILEKRGLKVGIIHLADLKPFTINSSWIAAIKNCKHGVLMTDNDYADGILRILAHKLNQKTNKNINVLGLDDRSAGHHNDVDNLPPDENKIVRQVYKIINR